MIYLYYLMPRASRPQTSSGKSTYKRYHKRFIPKSLKWKRINAEDTKTFYFKTNGEMRTNLVGTANLVFNSRALTQTPGAFPQFNILRQLYDNFKCVSMKIRCFPSNVGIEPHDPLLGSSLLLLRGNTISYVDQRAEDEFPPSAISEVINDASARMHNSRQSFSRSIYRASGFSAWGNLQNTQTADSWNGQIGVLTTNASGAPATAPETGPVLFYWTAAYKVIFRSRRT